MKRLRTILGRAVAGALLLLSLPAVDGYAADIMVTSFDDVLDDNDGVCSLREAVLSANADNTTDTSCTQGSDAEVDHILLAAGTYTLDLVNRTGEDDALDGDLDLIGPLEIRGVSAEHTVIAGVADESQERVVHVIASVESVVMRGLRVTGGTDETGGNILCESDGPNGSFGLELVDVLVDGGEAGTGGGIRVTNGSARLERSAVTGNHASDGGGISVLDGTVEILNSSVTDNTADIDGAGVHAAGTSITRIHRSRITGNSAELPESRGGGIFYGADVLDVQFSAIENNRAERGGGVFIANTGAELLHSALIGNTADLQGGGLSAEANGFVRHTTLAENTAPEGGGAHSNTTMMLFDAVTIAANSDGVFNELGALFEASLLAANEGGNCVGNPLDAGGSFNFDDGNSCQFPTGDPEPNFVDTDPMLEALADNSGPTRTFALSAGSPAIDVINSDSVGQMNCQSDPDQRGYPRGQPADDQGIFFCDIGAFELHGPYVVDSTADELDLDVADGICLTASDTCTLRAAVQQANATAGLEEIVLPAGQYVLTIPGGSDDSNLEGDLDINDALIIRGAGAEETVIDAAGLDRAFDINSDAIFQVDFGQLVRAPRVLADLAIINGVDDDGGGVVTEDRLHLERVRIANNDSSSNGGGLYCQSHCRIVDSTIADNSTQGDGGGLHQPGEGSLTVLRSSVVNNVADIGGGIEAQQIHLENVTVSGNGRVGSGANDFGGGVRTSFGVVESSTIVENTAAVEGGGLFVEISGVAANSIIAANRDDAGQVENCAFTGTFVSTGHNVSDSDGADCLFDQATDLPLTEPLREPLADNGGPTQTHALMTGSPAIDAGDDVNCPATDQRGFLRPGDGDGDGTASCDIGAYEIVRPDLLVTISDSSDPVVVGDEVTYTVTVTNAGAGPASAVMGGATLPAGLSFVSADAGAAICTESGSTVDCELGDMAPGDSLEIQVVASADQSGTVSVTATVSSAEADATPDDNSVTETTTVNDPTGGGGGSGGGSGGGTGGGGGGPVDPLLLLLIGICRRSARQALARFCWGSR